MGDFHEPTRESDQLEPAVTQPDAHVETARRAMPDASSRAGVERSARGVINVVGANRAVATGRVRRSTREIVRRNDDDIGDQLDASASAVDPRMHKITEQLIVDLFKSLGGGGAHWWRHDEVRNFRAHLKSEARTQAYRDLDVAVGKERAGKEASATSDYEDMVAGNIAYADSKESVDQVLQELARGALQRPEMQQYRDALWAAVQRGDGVSDAKKNFGAALKRWKDGVTGKRDWSGHVAGQPKPDRTKANWKMSPKGLDVAQQVADRVRTDEVGRKSLENAKIQASSVSTGLNRFAAIIDTIIASPGDVLDLSVEVVIPTGEGPNVNIKLAGTAARGVDGATTAGVTVVGDPNRVELSVKFSVGVSAPIPGVEVKGMVGVFVRAGSNAGTAAAVSALSYGLYRFAPDSFKDRFWAPPDLRTKHEQNKAKIGTMALDGEEDDDDAVQLPNLKKKRSATERAETWAAFMEHQYFGEGSDAFAHVGLGVDGEVGLNIADVAQMSIAFGDATFAKYDRDSLTTNVDGGQNATKQGFFGASLGTTPEAREQAAKDRRAALTGGVGFSAYLGISAKFEALGQSFEVSLSGSGSPRPGKSPNWGIDIAAGISTPSSAADPETALTLVNKVVDAVGKMIQRVRTATDAEAEGNGKFWHLIVGMPTDAVTLLDGLGGKRPVAKAISEMAQTQVDKGGTDLAIGHTGDAGTKLASVFDATSTLQFLFTFGMNGDDPVKRFELRSKRGIEIGGGSPVKFSGSVTSRLLAAGKDGDEKVLEIAGLSAV